MVEVVETLLMLDLLIAAKVPILPGPAEEMHGVSSCDKWKDNVVREAAFFFCCYSSLVVLAKFCVNLSSEREEAQK